MKRITAALLTLALAVSGTVALAAENENSSAGNTKSTLAFPTAEGGGMYTTGARGAADDGETMEVYHVTNLNDSGEGSFRDAVSKGNRIVVFDVSGMIDLKSRVSIGHDNMTILGQTAPGDGICFRGNSVKINGKNIILRYLRFRVGSKLADGSNTITQDGFSIPIGAENVIMDHCSVSWGTDENLSVIGAKNVSVQWSIVSEALNSSIHDKGEHSYAGIWGGVNVSFHHNIIATHKSRNPKIGTSETVSMTPGYTDKETVVDMWNNVFYNWGDKAGYGAENGANVNIVNNYYKPGPATPDNKRARIFELSPGNKYQTNWSGDIYASGNYVDDDSTTDLAKSNAAAVNTENWQIEKGTGVYLDTKGIETYNKLDELRESSYLYNKEVQTAQEAYKSVIADAGARLPKMDLVDKRIIENVTDRTAPENGSNGSSYLIDAPIDAIPEGDEALYDDRGYPIWTSESRAADYDSDGDGIADEWEDKMGLNKENPTDSLFIGPDGYTYLEIFAEEGITHNSGDITLERLSGMEVKVSSQTVDKVDIYLGRSKIKTAELTEDIPVGSTLITAAYEKDSGKLLEVKSAVCEGGDITYPTVTAENAVIKHFAWDSLEGMKPVGSGKSAVVNLSEKTSSDWLVGVYTLMAVSADKSSYSNMEYINGGRPRSGEKEINGDFTIVLYPREIFTTAKNAYGELSIENSDGEGFWVGAGTNSKYEKVIYDNGEAAALDDTTIIKIVREGDKISLYRGSSPLDMTLFGEHSFKGETANVLLSNVCPTGEIYDTNATYDVITEKTEPKIEITNVEENQRLGFNEDIEVNVTPDNAAVQQISISLNGKVIAQKSVNVRKEGKVTIPVTFDGIAAGELTAACVDTNLCVASDSVNVSVSADLTPWQIADIGSSENDSKTYVAVTNDYTYKINSPVSDGSIGGTADKCGYVYQKFSGDNRIYYRSRMQSAEQFGIMLRKSLDDDSAMYFFGGENDNGSYEYNIKTRNTTIPIEDLSGANLYFITEKVGNTLNIYQTENSSTVYTTKKLLYSIDVSDLGEEYYMGFASVCDNNCQNPPDAGWIGIDNSSGDSYSWNFNYGLDWCWQMQEANVLTPTWTAETIAGNVGGKMVLTADDTYSGDRYVFREYIMDDEYLPEMSTDIMLSGDEPAMNVYLQDGDASTAYKITFDSDNSIKDANGKEIGTWNSGVFYNVDMAVEIDTEAMEKVCKVTVTSSDDTIVYDIAIPTDEHFRTQINVEKKTPVKKAVYFEPISGVNGTYYIDNVSVTPKQGEYKIVTTESFYKFDSEESYDGLTLGGVSPELLSKQKTIGDTSFTSKVRLNKASTTATFPVLGDCEITIYAASANSSEARSIVINDGNETEMTFSSVAEQTYYYSGEARNITIYGKAGVDIYGIKVVSKQVVKNGK